jgi:hypothetical protein
MWIWNYPVTCSNTLTIAAAEATVGQVGKGIFKAPQWIKSSNDRK